MVWRKINDNLFTTQFSCLADWNKAMFEGPWLFRGQALIMKEYDGFKKPESIQLDRIAAWAQIHRLPNNFLIDQAVCGMASRIGEVEEIQLRLSAGSFGEFIRVKVNIDINAKIKRFVTGKKGDERVRYQVKYEMLPTFCFNCGEFGHWYEECGDGKHDESAFGWGEFVLADAFRAGHVGRGVAGPHRGRGSRGRAGGGRGRGRDTYNPNQSWRFNAHDQNTVNTGGRMET
ncbi:putative disease resistance protein RGA3 [Hordeum vulgare]|nr:putative disease resistance protein RGA3 [Hordeum vulgare]